MSVSLNSAVSAQLEDGDLRILPLVKFELPEVTVGYHFGGRDFVYGGVTYRPNKWLAPDAFDNALGNDITRRTLIFSGVQTEDHDDIIAGIEEYSYLNAPVTVSYLAGDPTTGEVPGILSTQYYEIDSVEVEKGAIDDDGARLVTVKIDIQPPQRRYRDQTYAKASNAEQQFDNDADDTFFEYAATSKEWAEEWGQVQW